MDNSAIKPEMFSQVDFASETDSQSLFLLEEDTLPTITQSSEKSLDGKIADEAKSDSEYRADLETRNFDAPLATMMARNSGESETRYQGLQWYQCDKDDSFSLLQKVEIKEVAVSDGLTFLRGLEERLISTRNHVPGAQWWIDKAQRIQKSQKNCEIMIGFLGVTGAGKSSLINALLEHEDLLPADDGISCTAVCVKIAYNQDDNPKKAFRASVVFVKDTDWRFELEGLAKDIEDDSANKDGEDGEIDVERADRIKKVFSKVKFVYPHIRHRKDFAQYSIDNLIKDKSVQAALGKKKVFECADKCEFSSKIRPYIDSNNSEEGPSFALWPLVESIQLDIKSQILKDGVCLVDLPGTNDTNSARGAIAENFQRNLAITCVVAESKRAASDKPAQDLLGAVRQRTMLLDQQFSSDRLCFIITKSDDSLKLERYIDKNPKLKVHLAYDIELESKATTMCNTAEQYHQKVLARSDSLANEAATMEQNLENLRDAYRQMLTRSQVPQKRKIDDKGEELKNRLEVFKDEGNQLKFAIAEKHKEQGFVASQLNRSQKKLNEIKTWLDNCKSRKIAACIQHRSRLSAARIRTDYDSVVDAATGKKKTTSNSSKRKQKQEKGLKQMLQVFSVSSKAFIDFRIGNGAVGFPLLDDTGIPGLQCWLVNSTLNTRKGNSEAVLQSIISFKTSIMPWLANSVGGPKVPHDDRVKMDTIFGDHLDSLREELVTASEDAAEGCEKLVENGILKKLAKAEAEAAPHAEGIARSWVNKPMSWASHRACNRALGVWKTYKGVELKWNAELAEPYLAALTPSWLAIFEKRLPKSIELHESKLRGLLIAFADNVISQCLPLCPQLSEQLQLWKESTLRSLQPIQERYLQVHDTVIQQGSKSAHRTVATKIQEVWYNIYVQCGAETGTGHYKRNQKVHVEHVKNVQRIMYKKCSTVVRSTFRSLWESLPEEFNQGTDTAVSQIADDFVVLLDNHTTYKDNDDLEFTIAKEKLAQDAALLFITLDTAWASVLKFEVPVKKEVVEEPFPTLDDLFAPQVIDIEEDIGF